MLSRITVRISILSLVVLAATAAPSFGQAGPEKLFFPPCAPFSEDLVFDCYRDYQEVTAFVQAAVRAYPDLARLESLGRSFQGRELWLVTVSDGSTGSADSKPALWVDGGIDSDEVVATEVALGLIHHLLTSDDARIRELLRSRTFYIAPNVMPDASELQHRSPIRPRDTTLRPWDDDGDGSADEDPPEDLDGDGQALQMRREDPLGNRVRDEADPRLMRTRRAGDTGPFYTVYLEGTDNDGDDLYQEDRLGGIDPNRNYPGNWFIEQGGSGPFPGSEPGLRAMLEFVEAHPNIAASQHFHSSGGVVLHPPSVPDFTLNPADRALYMDVSRRGLEVTGYNLATSVYDWNWPRGSGNKKDGQVYRNQEGELRGFPVGAARFGSAPAAVPLSPAELSAESGGAGVSAYPAYGGSIDAMYMLFGALAFANEIYALGEDYDGDGRIEPAEQLRYNDEVLDGYAFQPWTPFDHPQLGPVEIGGWRKFGQNNPRPDQLAEEVRRNVEFTLMQAELMPRIGLGDIEVEDLSGGVYRVTARVQNIGYQPTELAIRVEQGRAVPVRVSIDGVEVLSSETWQNLGVLAGNSDAEVEWVVRGSVETSFTIEAWHPKGGRAVGSGVLR